MAMNHKGTTTNREPIPASTEEVARQIVDAAFKVHVTLGPGLLESVYETCLVHELRKRGLRVSTQVTLPIEYDGLVIDSGLRLDLLVEDAVVVELKAAERLLPVHTAQILTYLKLTGHRLGLLIKHGIKRVVL